MVSKKNFWALLSVSLLVSLVSFFVLKMALGTKIVVLIGLAIATFLILSGVTDLLSLANKKTYRFAKQGSRQSSSFEKRQTEEDGERLGSFYKQQSYWSQFDDGVKEKEFIPQAPQFALPEEIAYFGFEDFPSEKELKTVYKKLAKVHHPDRGGDPKQFQDLTEKYSKARRLLKLR